MHCTTEQGSVSMVVIRLSPTSYDMMDWNPSNKTHPELDNNSSNAGATFVQSTRTQRLLKTIWTLSCWYSLESSLWVLSDEYPHPRVSVFFLVFSATFMLAILTTSCIRVTTCIGCYKVIKSEMPCCNTDTNSG